MFIILLYSYSAHALQRGLEFNTGEFGRGREHFCLFDFSLRISKLKYILAVMLYGYEALSYIKGRTQAKGI